MQRILANRFSCSVLGIGFCLALTLRADAQQDWVQKMRDLRERGKDQDRLAFVDKIAANASDAEKDLLRIEKALALQSLGKFEEALAVFDEGIQVRSNLSEYANLFAGQLRLQLGQDEGAEKNFLAVLELKPNMQLENEAKFQVAKLLLKKSKFAEAQKILVSLEKKQRGDKSYSEIVWELARAEQKMGHQAEFCKAIKRIFVSKPDSSFVVSWGSDLSAQIFDGQQVSCVLTSEERQRRIKNLQWAGMSEKAWREIEELRKLPGVSLEHVKMLEVLYHLHEGEVTQAMGLLLPMYDSKKSDFDYLTTLATAAARSGDSQLAVGSYYAAYKLNPKSSLGRQALYQSAFLSYQFQDYDGASRRFREFMKVYPNSGLAKDSTWHLAWIRYLKGDYEGAHKAFSELKNKRGKRSSTSGLDRIHYWMAMSLFRQNQFSNAKKVFEQILREGGQSYYALASVQRLKKVDQLIPKPVRPVLSEKTQRLARFTPTEFMMPLDGYDGDRFVSKTPSEESENEENLVLNPLSSGAEVTLEDVHEDEASPDKLKLYNVEVVENETRNSFADPVLLKRFERARDLMILGLGDWAKWDLYEIERRTTNKDYLKNLLGEYENIEQFHRSAAIAQNAFASLRHQYGIEGVKYLWQHAYPQAYRSIVSQSSQEFGVATEMIWGVMKAESSYKRDVVSPVGAIGLMQIMPNTGARVSELLKEKGFVAQNLFEPKIAIRLGAKYLQRLCRQFDYNYALVAAGYNAGPHRVRSWLQSFGQLDLDEFIEHVPFLETRNYVKKVMTNAWVYSQLYGGQKEFLANLSEPMKIRTQSFSAQKETWEDI